MRARVLSCLVAAVLMSSAVAGDPSKHVNILKAAEPGATAEVCRDSVARLAELGEKALVPILTGFDGATPLGQNWLRNAWEETVFGINATKAGLPTQQLVAFVLDTKNAPTARRLAYETLKSSDAMIEERIVPGLLLDPNPEFRRDAVARLIAEATASTDAAAATSLYRKALTGAVHEDQVQTIADALRKAGETVSIQQHFAFVPQWSVVGPFDNIDEKGFAVAYPPEAEAATGKPMNLETVFDGQNGKVTWKPLTTDDDYGTIDIAKQIENFKGSLMYATTVWNSPADQQLEIRLGTPNAWKLWVNGKLTFEREEYHRSSQVDQYRVPVALKAGPNVIVLKVCQNEMTQEWAQRYQFQLRICNSTGTGVLPADATKTAAVSGDVR